MLRFWLTMQSVWLSEIILAIFSFLRWGDNILPLAWPINISYGWNKLFQFWIELIKLISTNEFQLEFSNNETAHINVQSLVHAILEIHAKCLKWRIDKDNTYHEILLNFNSELKIRCATICNVDPNFIW